METTGSHTITVAQWAQGLQQSTIQQMLALTDHPDILSFALGLPATELFPVQEYAQAVGEVLAQDGRNLQYGTPCKTLKQYIVTLMYRRGVECKPEQVFLTSGAQQGMSLLTRLLLNHQGSLIVEDTIYSGILQAVEPLQPTLLMVPSDRETGIDVDAVASQLDRNPRPACIYVISDGHNPLGVSMSLEKRCRLVALARHYRVPILEDDAYGMLWYDSSPLPPLKALDAQWVYYLGSFSKILAPALRVGWIIVPEDMVSLLSTLKEGSDINTATFAQRTIAAYIERGTLPDHIDMLRREYQLRRDTMVRALRSYFPSEIKYHQPKHGMFIWVELPEGPDMERVFRVALEKEKVAFVPGQAFYLRKEKRRARSMRLNFSRCSPALIEQGMSRLARVIS